MFGWLTKHFKKDDQVNYDLYAPKERQIYRYWNGQSVILADPMLIWKRLTAVGPELSVHLKVAMSPMPDADKEHEHAARKIRGIFDLKPLAEGGLTEAEALELLDHFLAYCEQVKKNSKSVMTPSPSPAIWQGSTFPATPPSPPTSSTSDSGSTANGRNTASPQASPSASV